MSAAVGFQHIDVVFGPRPAEALRLLDQGLDRDAIQERTGHVIGVADATLAFFAGAGGLGDRIYDDITFKSNVVVAGGLAVLLAALLDALILLVQRAITPWTRAVATR